MKDKNNERISEKDMINQLRDLISDRRSFITDNKEANSPFIRDIKALEQVLNDYSILKNATLNSISRNNETIEIWINENVKSRTAEILNYWYYNPNTLYCNAVILENNRSKANIVINCNELNLMFNIGNQSSVMTDKFICTAFKDLIYKNYDRLIALPKLSKCSKLLKTIYNEVCESESSMCYISYEDWSELYSSKFDSKDIEKLKEEIKKYKLEDVIEIEDEYKILGYTDLMTRFNDDSNLNRNKKYER